MPTTLTFSKPLNVSCQIGDTAYYVLTTASGNFTVNLANVIEIGPISAINNPQSNAPTIVCSPSLLPVGFNPPPAFILFSKDNKANLSSILGYYLEMEFKSNKAGSDHEEIFSVGTDYFISSK
tara:strand:- start:3609 stop:3977 length:369 start_codon:yes stop_codon:yes gene_type:complete